MANAFAAGASGASWDRLTETAYDREVEFQNRDTPQWRALIDKRPVRQAMPGDVVVFTIHKELGTLATTPLTETVDPDAVAPQAPDRVQVTLNEHGNATLATLRLEKLAFTRPNAELAEIVGRNMHDTVDQLVLNVADGSTNLAGINNGVFLGTSVALSSVKATDVMNRDCAAGVVTLLRGDKVTPRQGNDYVAMAHPHVLYDVMKENSATAWNAPHTYGGDTGAIYAGEVGRFQGARYISTTRVTVGDHDGAGTSGAEANVYRTYFLGKQAIAEAVALEPSIVIGPQVDKLKRFFPLGWKCLFGQALFRPEALRKVYTASSLGGIS